MSHSSTLQGLGIANGREIMDYKTGEIVTLTLNEASVRHVIFSIKEHISSAREELYYLYENEAWEVLGYKSWHDLLVHEFSEHHSYLRRMATAARIEANVGVDIGTHKESHLRAISDVIKDEELQKLAYHTAIDVDAQTAQDFRKVSWVVYTNEYSTDKVKRRLRDGLLSPAQAYGLTLVAEQVESGMMQELVSSCSDPELAEMLVELSRRGGPVFEEIVITGCVPGMEEPIPLHQATASNLRAWLDVSSAERRAKHVENNRGRYQQAEEALSRFIKATQKLLAALAPAQSGFESQAFACEKALEDYLNARKQVNRDD